MSSVDDRIVNMQFNNRQFTQGASESQRALEGLDKTLAKTGTGSSGLSSMGGVVDGISGKFSALKVAGISALATVASRATSAGIDIVKSLTLDPIMEGFHNYETKINAVQTILANTKDQGTNLKEVTKTLNQLNTYANKTVYNFSEMAKNIGTFTAAGVNLKDATASIKGIANLAALSGSTSAQASGAMYQLSQAIAAGQVHLQDWNSVVNAGIGGAVFQKNLIQSAIAVGAIDKSQVHLGKTMKDTTVNGLSFRQSLTPPPGGTSWLTSKALTTSLSTFTGDMTKAQLVAKGFAPNVAKAIVAQGKMASNSATQIKTVTQLFQALKEEVGTAWAAVFEQIFGNINQAKKFLSPLHTALENGLTKPIYEVAAVLKGFRLAGGFSDLGTIFSNLGTIVMNLLYPFKVLFGTLFPNAGKAAGGAGSGLEKFTKLLATFTGWLAHASEFTHKYSDAFKSMGDSIKNGLGFIGNLVGQISKLGPVLQQAIGPLQHLGDQMKSIGANIVDGLLGGLDPGALVAAVGAFAQKIIDTIKNVLGIHSPSTVMMDVGVNIIQGLVTGLTKAIPLLFQGVASIISAFFQGFSTLFSGFNSMDFASLLNAALTGGLLIALKHLVDTLNSFGQIGGNLSKMFDGVRESMESWQKSLKAKMIMEIAIAIGILALSLIALSFIDGKKIAKGLAAIGIMMKMLTTSLASLSEIESGQEKANIALLATSLLIISFALLALAGAVRILGSMDLASLAKGVGAIGVLLRMMTVTLSALAKQGPQMEGAAGSIFVISAALIVLAVAVEAFGHMKLETLSKGFFAIGVALGAFVAVLTVLSKQGPQMEGAAGSIMVMAAAMVVLAGAVLAFGSMDLATLAKGIFSMGISLGIMVAAVAGLALIGPVALAGAASIAIMSVAMLALAAAVLAFGSMDLGTLAKGFIAMAIGLGILIAAGALAMAVAPGLEALGLAALMLGGALFLAGTGMAAFGAGFALLAATGAAGTAVIVATIQALLALLPSIAVQVAAAFIAFIKVIANASGQIRPLIGKIVTNILGVLNDAIPKMVHTAVLFISQLLKGITKLIPQFGHLINVLIKTGLDIITKAVPRYVAAGVTIITNVLSGLARNIPKMQTAAANLIIAFINGVAKQNVRIANAAGKAILDFLHGMDSAIKKYSGPIRSAGLSIARDLIDGLTGGLLTSGMAAVRSAATQIANALPGWMRKVLHISSPSKVMIQIGHYVGMGLAQGISESTAMAVLAAIKMANAVIAVGNKAIARAQESARRAQGKAYAAAAKADERAQEARDAQQFANQHKKDKAAQKRAKALQKNANQAQKHADKVQKEADRAKTRVDNVKAFQEADLHGKGDIRDQAAQNLADRAQKALATANVEAARARELMKTNRKAGQALLEQSRKDARQAAALAKRARASHKQAQEYYAREVNARIKATKDATAADDKTKADQAALDAADAQGKHDILTKRAEAHELEAKTQRALSEKLLAEAKKLAKTNAAKAMRLLDRADKASQAAKDAADAAEQERKDAQDALGQGSSSGTGATPSTITPSASVLQDAARAVDRYTQSLQEAVDFAAAQQNAVTFNQYNTSPESLTVSEIYRQSKNLLSAAEVKMGVTTSP